MSRDRRRFTLAAVIFAVFLLGALPAWAMIQLAPSFGTTSGDWISGWAWMRQESHRAQWFLPALPNAVEARPMYLQMDALVTNRTNGGAGHEATLRLLVMARDSNGLVIRDVRGVPAVAVVVVPLFNPFTMVTPPLVTLDHSPGIGYRTFGFTRLPPGVANAYLTTPGATLLMKYVWSRNTVPGPDTPDRCHVALNGDSVKIIF